MSLFFASHAREITAVPPTWTCEETVRDKNVSIELDYTVFSSGATPVHTHSEQEETFKFYDQLSEGEVDELTEAISSTVSLLDRHIREDRVVGEEQTTEHTISYRTGLGRTGSIFGALTSNIQDSIGLPFKFIPRGPAHFDSSAKDRYDSNRDSIIVCSGGRSTRIYEGPVPDVREIYSPDNTSSIAFRLATSIIVRQFSQYTYDIPMDVAYSLTPNTLHALRQQIISKNKPSFFMRDIVTVS